jgi:DNA-directed RNA polymerase subunit M/transcription elongation factor TFIIS
MKKLIMQNGEVLDADPEIRLDCTRCDQHREYYRKHDDPETVVRCSECGKRHSKHSLIDVNAAGVDA